MKGRSLATALWVIAASVACGDATPEAEEGASADPARPIEGVFGMAPTPVGGIPSVVELRGGGAPAADTAHAILDQFGLEFSPRELMIRLGQPTLFVNSETLAHNIHVRGADTDSTVFFIDTDPGRQVEFVFEDPGAYDVTCDEHPGMRAFIYVSDAGYAAFADRDGTFVLEGVPEGSYTLSVWSIDTALRSEHGVTVSGSSTEVSVH